MVENLEMNESISNICIRSLKRSKFFTTLRFQYFENNKKKKWDFVQCLDCVAIVIFNTSRNTFVCVEQFRPTVFLQNIPRREWNSKDVRKYDSSIGSSIEFCAGIIDNDKTIEEIAIDEIFQETGYEVSVERLEKITTLRSTGTVVYDVHMFYVEVDDSMKVGKGGGLHDEGEKTKVVELSLTEAKAISNNTSVNHHFAFIYGLVWFLRNKQ